MCALIGRRAKFPAFHSLALTLTHNTRLPYKSNISDIRCFCCCYSLVSWNMSWVRFVIWFFSLLIFVVVVVSDKSMYGQRFLGVDMDLSHLHKHKHTHAHTYIHTGSLALWLLQTVSPWVMLLFKVQMALCEFLNWLPAAPKSP